MSLCITNSRYRRYTACPLHCTHPSWPSLTLSQVCIHAVMLLCRCVVCGDDYHSRYNLSYFSFLLFSPCSLLTTPSFYPHLIMYGDNYDYNYDDMIIIFIILWSHLNCHFCTPNTRTLRHCPLLHSTFTISIVYFLLFFLLLRRFSFSSFLPFYTSPSLHPFLTSLFFHLLHVFFCVYRRHSDRRDGTAQTWQHSTRCKYSTYHAAYVTSML